MSTKLEIRNPKKIQVKHLDVRTILCEMTSSLNGVNSRLDLTGQMTCETDY